MIDIVKIMILKFMKFLISAFVVIYNCEYVCVLNLLLAFETRPSERVHQPLAGIAESPVQPTMSPLRSAATSN